MTGPTAARFLDLARRTYAGDEHHATLLARVERACTERTAALLGPVAAVAAT